MPDPVQDAFANRPQMTFKEMYENDHTNQNPNFWAAAAQASTQSSKKSTGTIFYTNCAAADLIYKRADIYAKKIRDTDAYQWLYKKIAYANAAIPGKIQLKTRNEEGLGSAKNKNSLYTIPPGVHKSNNGLNYSKGPRFLPNPHLVSVKTEYKGDFGSVQSCQIAFTVYSLDQLSNCQGFFQINETLSVNWGWENGGSAQGKPISFIGQIVNFSWSINADGGADCTSTAIGKGVNTLSTNASMTATKNNKTSTYMSGVTANKQLKTVTTLLDQLVANAPDFPYSLLNGLASIPKFSGWHGIDAYDKMSSPMTYCTLEKLISVINEKISDVGFAGITYKIGSASQGGVCKIPNTGIDPAAPKFLKNWASANPLECVFPGLDYYKSKNQGLTWNNFKTNFNAFAIGQTTSLGNILLNVAFLSSILESLGKTTDKGEKSTSNTLNDFFKKIFTSINLNSGGAIKISTAANPKNIKEILIIDTQYMPAEIQPVVIPAISENSICRSMSLSAKIPSELTSAASVAANSGAGSVNSAGIKPFTKFNTKIIKKDLEEQPTDEVQKIVDKTKEEIKVLNDKLKDFDAYVAMQKNEDPEDRIDYSGDIKEIKEQIAVLDKNLKAASNALASPLELIGSRGPSTEFIADAQAYLKSVGSDKDYSVVYPLDFSFTIDGINGIKFGDAVTSNYMPAVYRDNSTRCAFTVLNVSHEIAGGDWTTSCTTVFRVRP